MEEIDFEALLNNELFTIAVGALTGGTGLLVTQALQKALTLEKVVDTLSTNILTLIDKTDDEKQKQLYNDILINMPVEQRTFMENIIKNKPELSQNRFINTNWY